MSLENCRRSQGLPPEAIELDKRLTGMCRSNLLYHWTLNSPNIVLIYKDILGEEKEPVEGVNEKSNRIGGFAILKNLGAVWMLCPLISESHEICKALLSYSCRIILEEARTAKKAPPPVAISNFYPPLQVQCPAPILSLCIRVSHESTMRPMLEQVGLVFRDAFPAYRTQPDVEYKTEGSFVVWTGALAPF